MVLSCDVSVTVTVYYCDKLRIWCFSGDAWAYFGQSAKNHGMAQAETPIFTGVLTCRPADYQSAGLNYVYYSNESARFVLCFQKPSPGLSRIHYFLYLLIDPSLIN